MSRLFCFGLGYSAEVLARRLSTQGWRIAGTARTREGAARLAGLGYEALVFDGQSPAPGVGAALADATHILVSAAPDENGDPSLRWHRDDLAGAAALCWVGYLSTIGVYGDAGGDWIDEMTPPNPGAQRTHRRVAAESDWLAFGRARGAGGPPVQVFRLGGIYGPGRSAVDDLREGTARRIVKPGQVFNRIHVGDIAGVLEAAARGAGTHTLYNVVDDEPAPPQDVVAYAAGLMGLAVPPEIAFEDAPLTPMGRSFYAANRRVRNRRLHDDLGVRLRYPSYREGLAAILAGVRSETGLDGGRDGAG